MRVVKPVTVTDAMLISSNVADTSGSYSAWDAATSYTLGQVVYRSTTHRIYTNLIPGVDATLPEESALLITPRWADGGPINRWAMFDNQVSTETTNSGSIAVTLKPGIVNSLALINIVGVSVDVVMATGGSTVYSKSVNLDMSEIADWYDYFFAGFESMTQVVFDDLPPFSEGEITATLSGGGVVKCGALIVGSSYGIGDIKYDPTIEIMDYSVKSTDEFGITTFVQRQFAKRVECAIIIENNRLKSVFALVASLRAVPSVWITHDDEQYSLMTVFGWYAAFSITIPYPNHSLCTLQIQGLT
jgi:hypothetical protein